MGPNQENKIKNLKGHHWLLIALVLGMTLGAFAHEFAAGGVVSTISSQVLEPIGQLFLRLIFMTVVPVVFCGLVLGVYQLSQHQGLGRTASRTLFFTLLTSAVSVLIGVALVNIVRPGVGVLVPADLAQNAGVEKIKANASAAKSFTQSLIDIVPKNPIQAASLALDGEMLALMFFALVFGFALSRSMKTSSVSHFTGWLEVIYEACMEIVHLVMRAAPVAVFALVFASSFKFGVGILFSLALYVGTVVVGLSLQQFFVYPALLQIVARRNPLEFFRSCYDVLLYAFATASSNATLPKSLEAATKQLGLSPETSRFVLTVGSTANQNGTALFEGVTVLFLAQIYQIDLSIAQQIQVVVMSVLAGVGTAGVPGGSLPLIMILLQQMGIPPEGLGIVLGVDRFLDMCRTAINVSGDLVIAAVVEPQKKT